MRSSYFPALRHNFKILNANKETEIIMVGIQIMMILLSSNVVLHTYSTNLYIRLYDYKSFAEKGLPEIQVSCSCLLSFSGILSFWFTCDY